MRRAALVLLLLVSVAGPGCGGTRKERDPRIEAATRLQTAEAYLSAGRFQEARELVEQALAVQPTSAPIHNFLGQIHFLSGRHAEAEAAFRKALELDATLADAHNNLGALYDRTNRKAEAEAEYRKALAELTYPTPQKVHLNLALLYASQGRDDEALRALRTAVEIDPRYYQAHFELASLLDRTGKLEEAAREYEVAAPDYRNRGDYHYRLGFVYYRLGQTAKAQEHLRRVLEVSPGSESAAKSDELLRVMR